MEDSYGREETQVIDEEESGRRRTPKGKRDPKSWKRNVQKKTQIRWSRARWSEWKSAPGKTGGTSLVVS